MSVFPISIPTKRLGAGITPSSTTFTLNNIYKWDGTTSLAQADFGTVAYGCFRNLENTLVEFFSFDPSTIASATITFVDRGLAWDGSDPTAVATARKLSWTASDTVVELGSHFPALFNEYITKGRDETKTGLLTVSQFPVKSGLTTPTSAGQLATKAYVDATATGSAIYDQEIIAGTAGEILTAGQLVYFKSSDQKWWLVDLDTSSTYKNVQLGFAQSAVAADAAVNILIAGLEKNQSGMTPGSDYFASGTAGSIQATVAASKERVFVGRAKSATILIVNFRQTDQVLVHSLQNSEHVYAASSAGTDTYAITVSPIPIAYAAGQKFRFKADVANTGAATLNVNSLGAVAIKKLASIALDTGDIVAGQIVEVVHDGTNFQMVNKASQTNLSTSLTAVMTLAANDAVYLTGTTIRLDSTGSDSVGAGTDTCTVPMTFTGSNRIALIGITNQNQSALTSVTVNGVAATVITSQTDSTDIKTWLYYILAPATGNVTVVRSSTTGGLGVSVVSYTGALQSAQPDGSDTETAANGTASVITAATNCLGVMILYADTGGAAGAGSTLRTSGGQGLMFDSAGQSPRAAGSTISMSYLGTVKVAAVMATIAPVSSTVAYAAKADADYADTTDSYIGFAAASAAVDASVSVYTGGVVGGFTSLTIGATYYLSGTPGAISLTPGAIPRAVGRAISATEILMVTDNEGGSPTGFANWQPSTATDGTDTAPANGTQFVTSLWVPHSILVTNINYLIGSVGGTDKVYGVIYNSLGYVLANTSLTGGGATVGTAANIQTVALTAPYGLTPGRYFVGISMNGNTARLRTVPAFCQAGILAGSISQTHGTSPVVNSITVPTTFTADKAPIIFLN